MTLSQQMFLFLHQVKTLYFKTLLLIIHLCLVFSNNLKKIQWHECDCLPHRHFKWPTTFSCYTNISYLSHYPKLSLDMKGQVIRAVMVYSNKMREKGVNYCLVLRDNDISYSMLCGCQLLYDMSKLDFNCWSQILFLEFSIFW